MKITTVYLEDEYIAVEIDDRDTYYIPQEEVIGIIGNQAALDKMLEEKP